MIKLKEKIIVKKKHVTSSKVKLKNIHPDKNKLKDKGEKFSDKTAKATNLGVKLNWKDYNNNDKEIKDMILVIPLDTPELEYDNYIAQAVADFERNNQDDEWSRLVEQYGTENKDMILLEEGYE